jgi:hypothetical protein
MAVRAHEIGRRSFGICATTLRADGTDFKVLVQSQSLKCGLECYGNFVFCLYECETYENAPQNFEKKIASSVGSVEM